MDFAEEIKYWTDRLNRTDAKLDELHVKLYRVPFVPLTIEETIELRYLIENHRADIRLLTLAVETELDVRTPFWKKLFRK